MANPRIHPSEALRYMVGTLIDHTHLLDVVARNFRKSARLHREMATTVNQELQPLAPMVSVAGWILLDADIEEEA